MNFRRAVFVTFLLSSAVLVACSGSGSGQAVTSRTAVLVEQYDCVATQCSVTPSTPVITTLETLASSSTNGADYLPSQDDGGIAGQEGVDRYVVNLPTSSLLDLCFVSDESTQASAFLYDGSGRLIASMHSQLVGYDCAHDAIAPVALDAGVYKIELVSDQKSTQPTVLALSLDPYQLGSTSQTDMVSPSIPSATPVSKDSIARIFHPVGLALARLMNYFVSSVYAAAPQTLTFNISNAPSWTAGDGYTAFSIVNYKGALYTNSSWAAAGLCPAKIDCPTAYSQSWISNPWSAEIASVKYEFDYYDYQTLLASYPSISTCAQNQYSTDSSVSGSVPSVINSMFSNGGQLASAMPVGLTEQQILAAKNALYTEYMLPCQPDLTSYVPSNVERIQRVMPLAVWKQFASNAGLLEGSAQNAGSYPSWSKNSAGDYVKTNKPIPMSSDFSNADLNIKMQTLYNKFLSAAAKYPYFCGEQGFYSSADEACKRELASLFGHAAVETGDQSVTKSFTWLRESGGTNATRLDANCPTTKNGFNCPKQFQFYYGRGPKQLSYWYNYGGFSASYFAGNAQFLLTYPDLVAFDPNLYFTSAIWFVMNHQPPKPSIHDVMLGKYKPPTGSGCSQTNPCSGVVFSDTTGVKNNFSVTIEMVNGAVECRANNLDPNAQYYNAPGNRIKGYLEALAKLSASLTADELALNDNLHPQFSDYNGAGTAFANPDLNPKTYTWLDVTGNCKLSNEGGGSMVSAAIAGIIDICRAN